MPEVFLHRAEPVAPEQLEPARVTEGVRVKLWHTNAPMIATTLTTMA